MILKSSVLVLHIVVVTFSNLEIFLFQIIKDNTKHYTNKLAQEKR